MSNSIVSIRIPESMVKELRERTKKDHFLDLSEAVRSVVRKRWLEWKDPGTYQIKKLRKDIKGVVEEKTKTSKQEKLLMELERIKELLEEEKEK